MQTFAWGELKARHAWQVHRLQVCDDKQSLIGAASVLVRSLPWPLHAIAYLPRGPLVADFTHVEAVTTAIADWVRKHLGAVALTFEPGWEQGAGPDPATWNRVRRARTTILYPETLIISLAGSLDELFGTISKRTRQYIRRAERDGLAIRPLTTTSQLDAAIDVYREIATRANFPLHTRAYYHDLFELAGEANILLGAYAPDGELVAFSWTLTTPALAFDLYGGVNSAGQKLNANRALQWAAIKACHARTVKAFDFNGLLGAGISAYKRSFADHTTSLVGTFDVPLSPLYPLWDRGLPLIRTGLETFRKLLRR